MLFNYSTITGGLYNLLRCYELYSAVVLEKNCTLRCNVIYFQTIYILSSNFMSVIFSQPRAGMPSGRIRLINDTTKETQPAVTTLASRPTRGVFLSRLADWLIDYWWDEQTPDVCMPEIFCCD